MGLSGFVCFLVGELREKGRYQRLIRELIIGPYSAGPNLAYSL